MKELNVVAIGSPVSDHLGDRLREGAKQLLAQDIAAEWLEWLSKHSEKTVNGREAVVRNGYLPERTIQAGIGDVRLTNPDDQNVIKRLFHDSLGDFSAMLPILDIGEGLIVGDASLLPSRMRIDIPDIKPNSATVDFWDEWGEKKQAKEINDAIEALRRQQKSVS